MVVRDAVPMGVDNLDGLADPEKDGLNNSAATPYASTPFMASPPDANGGDMTPFSPMVGTEGGFSPAVDGSFSPAYSPSGNDPSSPNYSSFSPFR